ncbi:peptidyl-prolyl cis-trans isomerase A (cyclophilin A) [Draconibacterium orientale]|uniref:peptidylprolyl isomerase n=1 Tax=Draconibacterium orientale TaxID=1168034 RepID=X5DF84_9BACT|nr:peptidylprolyl isomerase [Draconibacterium orientale]AHW59042.1 peptidylprolyl isomerase [Draconibacterium orientale]SET60358.1 peptidyl-prolyl cis-trans isomerase A (cyclophilin A) [Draconibacterium orientale]
MRKAIIFIIPVLLLAFQAATQELPRVEMQTELGIILVEIDTINAPLTATNFLQHVEAGTYKNACFYRVVRLDNQPNNDVKIQVIQGGMYTEPRFETIQPIAHETTEATGLKHLNGTMSMARMEPGTASTEFFICVGDQPELDFGGKRNPDGQGFAAFGQVISGMDVVRKIQQQKDEQQTLVDKVKIKEIKTAF